MIRTVVPKYVEAESGYDVLDSQTGVSIGTIRKEVRKIPSGIEVTGYRCIRTTGPFPFSTWIMDRNNAKEIFIANRIV